MRRPFLLALVLTSVACGSPSEPARPGLVLCEPPVVVTTTATAQGPRFSWSPACGATYLEVTSLDHQQVYWIVQGDTGKIGPGVTYGVEPPAYGSRLGPNALEVGGRYAIRLGLMVEEESFFIVGEGAFTR